MMAMNATAVGHILTPPTIKCTWLLLNEGEHNGATMEQQSANYPAKTGLLLVSV